MDAANKKLEMRSFEVGVSADMRSFMAGGCLRKVIACVMCHFYSVNRRMLVSNVTA